MFSVYLVHMYIFTSAVKHFFVSLVVVDRLHCRFTARLDTTTYIADPRSQQRRQRRRQQCLAPLWLSSSTLPEKLAADSRRPVSSRLPGQTPGAGLTVVLARPGYDARALHFLSRSRSPRVFTTSTHALGVIASARLAARVFAPAR